MNLLEKMMQKDHLFNGLINIKDDKTIISYSGDEIVIYADNRTLKESLGRELFLRTALNSEKDLYKSEEVIGHNDKRFDSMATVNGVSTSLIEFKNVDMQSGKQDEESIDVLLKQTLVQAEKYLKHVNNDVFFSIVITDCDKMVNDSTSYMNYFEDNDFLKSNIYYTLKNNGLAIITYQYNHETKTITPKSNNTPMHVCVERITNKILGKKNIPFADKDDGEIGIKVINAINVPTSGSKSVSVRNVRDIKDLTDMGKKMIVESILRDLLAAFKVNPNNQYAFFEEGHHKHFQYISSETLIHEKNDRAVIVTLDGALVDGQNSVNSFGIIANTLKLHLLKGNLTPEQISLISKISSAMNTYEMNDFLNFIHNLYIRFSFREIIDYSQAVHSAYVKNNSMPVKEEEIILAKISSPINALSVKLLNHGKYLDFPKKKKFEGVKVSVFDYIHIRKAINLITREDSKNGHFLKLATQLNKEINDSTLNKLKGLLNYEGVLEENKPEYEQIDKEIEKEINSKNVLEDYYSKEYITEDKYSLELKTINAKIKVLNERKRAMHDLSFKDIDAAVKEINKYIRVNKIIESHISPNDVELFTKGYNGTQGFKKIIILFDMLFLIINKEMDIESVSDEEIRVKTDKIINNFKYVLFSYYFEITSFRNPKDSKILNRDENGKNITTKDFYEIIMSDEIKDLSQIKIIEDEIPKVKSNIRQEDLITIFQELFIEKKKQGINVILSDVLLSEVYGILNNNLILKDKFNDDHNSRQIVRNFVSNNVFEKYQLGKYNSDTKMIDIY